MWASLRNTYDSRTTGYPYREHGRKEKGNKWGRKEKGRAEDGASTSTVGQPPEHM